MEPPFAAPQAGRGKKTKYIEALYKVSDMPIEIEAISKKYPYVNNQGKGYNKYSRNLVLCADDYEITQNQTVLPAQDIKLTHNEISTNKKLM